MVTIRGRTLCFASASDDSCHDATFTLSVLEATDKWFNQHGPLYAERVHVTDGAIARFKNKLVLALLALCKHASFILISHAKNTRHNCSTEHMALEGVCMAVVTPHRVATTFAGEDGTEAKSSISLREHATTANSCHMSISCNRLYLLPLASFLS